MTIKDFAAEHDISVSTINAYVRRHAKEFDGHLTLDKDGKTRILDDTAIALLNKKYTQSTSAVQIITPDPDSKKKIALIQNQQTEIDNLISHNKQLEQDLLNLKQSHALLLAAQQQHKDQMLQLENQLENQRKLAFENDKRAVIAETKLEYEQHLREKAELELLEKNEIILTAEKRIEEAELNASSFVPLIFGLFIKKKKPTTPTNEGDNE